jgi:uncharacterized protein with ATP-grasp and redox domains
MRTYFDCIACSVRQVLDSVRMISDDESVHERVIRELLAMWQRVDMRQSPPAMAQQIHRLVRQITGVRDPYLEVKNRYNEFALGLYPELRERVERSPDPFETAVRLAIAGNIIDFGVNSNIEQHTVHEAIMRSLTEPLDLDALAALKQAIGRAKDILFLGDNTGEIVLDRLLLERMPREKVTYVVRGGPILNDALMADAEVAGLTDIVEVIDNGSDAPGTIPETCSESFCRRFEGADLIIAKGQGNFETMNDTPKNAFFLLRPKCAVLARHLNCQLGRLLILRSGKAATQVP